MSNAQINAGLLAAIAMLIVFLLGLSIFQKRNARIRPGAMPFLNLAAPVARWILGLLILTYLLYIAFQLQHRIAPITG